MNHHPHFELPFALPIASGALAAGAFARVLGASEVNEATTIPLVMAISAMAAIGGFIFWFATERANTKNAQRRQNDRQRAQSDLLIYLVENLPQINEHDVKVRRLLTEMQSDQVETNREARERRERGTHARQARETER